MGVTRVPSTVKSVAVDTVVADSEEVSVGDCTGVAIFVPAGSSITSVAFYGAVEAGGTYLPLYDTTNTAVTLTVAAGRAYQAPFSVFPLRYMKLVGNADGNVDLTLKG